MLGEVLDNRRVYVITIVTLLVFSGLVMASSSSGVSPVYNRAYRIAQPVPILLSVGVANPAKVIAPIKAQEGFPIVFESVQTKGFSFFGLQSSVSVTERSAFSGSLLSPPVGAIVATGPVGGAGGALEEGPVVTSGGVMLQSSGQVVSVTALPGGQFVILTGSSPLTSAQFIQPSQIFMKMNVGLNELGSSPQPSYTGLTTVTAAIPGLWLDSCKRRTRSQIYIEILELMKRGPMTPFEIAFYARLNHKRTKEYAEFLKRSGYLECREEDGKLIYVLSKDGLGFLDRVRSLFESQPKDVIPNIDYGFTTR